MPVDAKLMARAEAEFEAALDAYMEEWEAGLRAAGDGEAEDPKGVDSPPRAE